MLLSIQNAALPSMIRIVNSSAFLALVLSAMAGVAFLWPRTLGVMVVLGFVTILAWIVFRQRRARRGVNPVYGPVSMDHSYLPIVGGEFGAKDHSHHHGTTYSDGGVGDISHGGGDNGGGGDSGGGSGH